MIITGIVWDLEDDGVILSQEELNIPSEIEIDDDIEIEDIADYISNEYGYCVKCFNIE